MTRLKHVMKTNESRRSCILSQLLISSTQSSTASLDHDDYNRNVLIVVVIVFREYLSFDPQKRLQKLLI